MMLVFIDIYEGTRRYFCIVTMVTAFLMFAVCTPMSTVPLNGLEMVADPHIVPSSRLSAPARIGPGFTVGSAFNMMLAVLGIVGTIVNVIQKLEYQVGKYPTNVLSK